MATTNNITTTYVGKDSGQFISTVLQSGVTLGTPKVTIHQNVNYRQRITQIETSGLIADATCAFTPVGTIDQTEVWLDVKKLEVNLELCKNDYYQDFVGEGTGAWGSLANGAFLRYLSARIGADVADDMETKVWQGVAGAGSFDGFETLALADATVVDVATPIAPVAATIKAEIRRGIALANLDILGKEDLYIYMSKSSYQALVEANNDAAQSACGENCIAVDGIKVFRANGMVAGSYMIARQSNLHFGTWASADQNRLSVIDQEPLDGSDNMNFVMKFFAGCQIGIGAEVVHYDGASIA